MLFRPRLATQIFLIAGLVAEIAVSTSSYSLAAIDKPPSTELRDVAPESKQTQLEAILKQSGNDPYVMEELGRILYRGSNQAMAKQLWDRASAQDPNIAPAPVQMVFADIASNQLDSAQKRLDALNVATTKDPHVVIAAGELAMVRGDFKKANDLLQHALDMAPQLGATQLALGHFMETARQTDTARSFYKKATELQPDRSTGWLRLAALDFQQGRAKEAFNAYQRAEKCRGNQPLAETRMGEAYLQRGDTYSAYRLFSTAVERKKEDPFPRLRLAQVLERTGRGREAQNQLEQILKAQEYPEALKVLGDTNLKAGKLDTAIGYYRRALKARPDDWIVANNLALLLVQTKGSAEEAAKLIDQAMKTAPQTPAALEGTKGCVLWYAGQNDAAEPLLKRAVAALPENAWTRYCYGQVLLAKKRPAEAREQFEACQFLEPTFQRRDEVSLILSRLGQEGQARWDPEWKRDAPASKPAPPTKPEPDSSRSLLQPGGAASSR